MSELNQIPSGILYHNIQFFPEYWKGLKPIIDVDDNKESNWLKKVEILDALSSQNNVAIFLWNAFTNRFIYMSDKLHTLGGYDPVQFTKEGGVSLSISNIHPDHLKAALTLYEEGMNYGIKNGLISFEKIVLSFNYLYKNALGKYIQMLQQCTILDTDDQMQPKLVLSFAQNISHIKKESSVGLIISAPTGIEIIGYDLNKKCISETKFFSNQEKKIIELLGQGFDTKRIAGLLNISAHTVDTHRRNLIRKTGCLDTTAVVSYARLINLI